MKKKFFLAVLAMFIILCGASGAEADIVFLGTVSDNDPTVIYTLPSDPPQQIQDTRVKLFLDTIFKSDYFKDGDPDIEAESISFYAKVEPGEDDNTWVTLTESGLSLSSNDHLSGTWQAEAPISFFSVKANNGYALYFVEGYPLVMDGAISGTWSTEELAYINPNNGNPIQPTISHFAAWVYNGEKPTTLVPEPATLLLMGFGLIGIAKLQRKRK